MKSKLRYARFTFMFTGIIRFIGEVKKISEDSKIKTFSILCEELNSQLGDSIAINGVCLTVSSKNGSNYTFDVVFETLSHTTLGEFTEGQKVNIEKSLTLQSGIDGHLVTGHVDAVATLSKIHKNGKNLALTVYFPKILKKFIAEKGSVTLNGVSLTVTKISANSLTVTVVPHTVYNTTFNNTKIGDHINLEVDVIARYVYNMAI